MKRWLAGIVAFPICLCLGAVPKRLSDRYSEISLCEISAHRERYVGKIVRVRVLVSKDVTVGSPVKSEPFIVAFNACSGTNEWATATLDLNEKSSSALPTNVHVWRNEPDIRTNYINDGIVVGRFDPHDDGITHCFAPQYELANAKLERVVSTTQVRDDETVAWVKSNSH